jgi:uncharacterized protein (TIGR03437 family)
MIRKSILLLGLLSSLTAAVTYTYDPAGRLALVDYGNGATIAYTYDKAGNLLSRVSGSASAGPRISAGGLVNSASYTAPLVRGGLASIFGTNLSNGRALSATNLPLPTTLADVQVTVGGIAAPVYYVSPMQINFQVPFEAPVSGGVPVIVIQNGTPSPPQQVTMGEYAPGVFTYARTSTALDPIIVHFVDNSLVSPDNPASANEVLVIYATGIGSFDNPPATGAPAVASPLASSLVTPSVTVGGAAALVFFAGLTPGNVGLVQINIQLPAVLPSGSSLRLTIAFGTNSAQPVTLYVH